MINLRIVQTNVNFKFPFKFSRHYFCKDSVQSFPKLSGQHPFRANEIYPEWNPIRHFYCLLKKSCYNVPDHKVFLHTQFSVSLYKHSVNRVILQSQQNYILSFLQFIIKGNSCCPSPLTNSDEFSNPTFSIQIWPFNFKILFPGPFHF